MTNAALIGPCRHMVGMRTTYEDSKTVTAIASGRVISLVPPMAMNTSPTRQPTSVLVIRARKISIACFIAGSLVATIELIAQMGLASAILCTRTQSIAVAKKMLTA